jgi:hypothetical protein
MYERIRIADFNPTEENAMGLAKTYAEVFAGDPWNEVTQCIGCNRFFGPDSYVGMRCKGGLCDGEPLTEAFPVEKTALDLIRDANRSGSAAKVLLSERQPVGFAFGFPYTNGEFEVDRYNTSSGREVVSKFLNQLGLNAVTFYISEVGIKPEFRGNGYSNTLVDELIDQASLLELGLLMRTNRESPMVAVAKRARMGQIMGPEVAISDQYVSSNGVMRLERKIISSGIPVNMMDPENPDRVLFVAPYQDTRRP